MTPSLLAAPRSRPRDSLGWMRWDFPFRIVPFLALPLLLAALTPLSTRSLGLTLHNIGGQLALSALLGPVMFWLSWWYRRRFVRRVVAPTGPDALLQSVYYVFLNSPAEELFFRGLLIGWMQSAIGPVAAWLLSTLLFGLYHIPAGWGWRAVGGVTLGGAIFGVMFLVGPGAGSLLLAGVVHAFATCGFLSAGPWAAHSWEARRVKKAAAGSTSA